MDVAYVPDLAFNLFSLMAAHKQGVGFTTEAKDLCISLFNRRLRFEGDGSGYSGFADRIELDDGYVPFPLLTPNLHETCLVTIFPLPFPCLDSVVSHLPIMVWTLTFSHACMVTRWNLCCERPRNHSVQNW